jgi:hypothetical protein
MKDYIPPSFEEQELEITNAISTLKRHGINIQLSENLSKRFAAKTLFDGDDGLFKELIKHAKTYYEYGCGKSTEFVFKYSSATIFSVDTSNDWVKKIKSLEGIEKSKRLNLSWVDVGEVANWGTPTSFKMKHNFRNYAELLWLNNAIPDLVLIDGRFRILCFLTSIKFAPAGCKILFDDYIDRPFYHIVEDFCPKLETCGRQALFEVSEIAKEKVSEDLIKSFQNVIL